MLVFLVNFDVLMSIAFSVSICTDYVMIPADLTQLAELNTLLEEAHFDFTLPTFILSEVVLTYIKSSDSSSLIKWAADCFTNAVFATYEQICPHDPFGLFMCVKKFHFKSVPMQQCMIVS